MIGFDCDPIPVLPARASLSRIPLDEKESIFQNFTVALEQEIKSYFETNCSIEKEKAEIQFVLYAARKFCKCGEVLVLHSFVLHEEPDGNHKRIQDLVPDVHG